MIEKVDKKMYDTEISYIKKDIEEVKQMAMSNKDKAHLCIREDQFNEIKKSFSTMNKVKLGTAITIIILIITGVAQYYGFKNIVNNNSLALTEIKQAVKNLSDNQHSLQKEFFKETVKQEKNDRGNNELKAMLKTIVNNMKDKKRRKR